MRRHRVCLGRGGGARPQRRAYLRGGERVWWVMRCGDVVMAGTHLLLRGVVCLQPPLLLLMPFRDIYAAAIHSSIQIAAGGLKSLSSYTSDRLYLEKYFHEACLFCRIACRWSLTALPRARAIGRVAGVVDESCAGSAPAFFLRCSCVVFCACVCSDLDRHVCFLDFFFFFFRPPYVVYFCFLSFSLNVSCL